jgi:hypothetical protein
MPIPVVSLLLAFITLQPDVLSIDHPFPLIRGGGLLLICVGAGFLLGWVFFPRIWVALAIAGAVLGFVASAFSPLLSPPLGRASLTQILALSIAIVFEIIVINYVVRKYQSSDSRTLALAILLVVGLHFIIMGVSHGPLMAILGILTTVNAWIGLRLRPSDPLVVFGVIDSVLKITFGLWMALFYPTFTLGF